MPDITVTVLALVGTKTPVRHHGRKAGESGVLRCDFLRSRTSKEVEIKNTTKGVVLEVLSVFGRVVDLDVHAGTGEEEDAVGAGFAAVLEVDWVVAVQTCGD